MKSNDYQIIVTKTRNLLNEKKTIIIAIDGRCASGKTTLANLLQEEFSCNVIHMDDFYLPISKRDSNWRTMPAKNIDFEKLHELLDSLSQKDSFEIRPYSCNTSSYGEPILHQKTSLIIIEGTYCCHPTLKEFYDLSVFLTVSSKEQEKRLVTRNGEEGFLRFWNLWIPLEEKYFIQYEVPTKCDIIITN